MKVTARCDGCHGNVPCHHKATISHPQNHPQNFGSPLQASPPPPLVQPWSNLTTRPFRPPLMSRTPTFHCTRVRILPFLRVLQKTDFWASEMPPPSISRPLDVHPTISDLPARLRTRRVLVNSWEIGWEDNRLDMFHVEGFQLQWPDWRAICCNGFILCISTPKIFNLLIST